MRFGLQSENSGGIVTHLDGVFVALGALTGAATLVSIGWWSVDRWRHRASRTLAGGARDRATRAADLVLAGVELGGTTSVAAISVGSPTNVVERFEVDTSTPPETIELLCLWLREKHEESGGISALGIATFGPVNVVGNRDSNPKYGMIGMTPKTAWVSCRLIETFEEALERSQANDSDHKLVQKMQFSHGICVDTDVNAPALGEAMHGSGIVGSVAYVTVGTGIGVGAFLNGATVHGRLHPEGGHIYVPRKPGDHYVGACATHRDCLEGLACAKALAERAGVDTSQLASLPDEHRVWDTCAYYLAQLCASITYLLAPERIVLGGGIMRRSCLFRMTRRYFDTLVAGYLGPDLDSDSYIVPSRFGINAGVVGACELARQSIQTTR